MPAFPLTLCLQRRRLDLPLAKRLRVAFWLPRRNVFASVQSGVVPARKPRCWDKGGVTPGCRNGLRAAVRSYGQRKGPSQPISWNSPNVSPPQLPRIQL